MRTKADIDQPPPTNPDFRARTVSASKCHQFFLLVEKDTSQSIAGMARLWAIPNSIQPISPIDFKSAAAKSPPHKRHYEPLSRRPCKPAAQAEVMLREVRAGVATAERL